MLTCKDTYPCVVTVSVTWHDISRASMCGGVAWQLWRGVATQNRNPLALAEAALQGGGPVAQVHVGWIYGERMHIEAAYDRGPDGHARLAAGGVVCGEGPVGPDVQPHEAGAGCVTVGRQALLQYGPRQVIETLGASVPGPSQAAARAAANEPPDHGPSHLEASCDPELLARLKARQGGGGGLDA